MRRYVVHLPPLVFEADDDDHAVAQFLDANGLCELEGAGSVPDVIVAELEDGER